MGFLLISLANEIREHLTFQDMLRMDKSVSKEDKINRIEKLLKDVFKINSIL